MRSTAFDIFAAAAEVPGRLALVSDGAQYTYRALAELVREQAAGLHAQGALQAPRVVLSAEVSPESVARVLALLAYGVPMVMVHPRLTAPERARLEAECAPALSLALPLASAAPAAPAPPAAVDPEAIAAVFFTSGTSGVPKGACLSRRALHAACEASARRLGWQAQERWLLSIPVAHIGGFSILLRCLMARRTVVLAADPGPEAFVHAVGTHGVTLASLVPTQLFRILELNPSFVPPPQLRAVLLGGAAASPTLVARAEARGFAILRTYGLTEACAQVATQAPGEVLPPGCVGHPLIPGSVQIRQGRIYLRTPALMSGYLQGGGLGPNGGFDTQDLGELDAQGRLWVHGRRSDLIISGGENVYPQEVEDALHGLPGVQEALVFGLADPEWGQVVCAALVPGPGSTRATEPYGAQLAGRLAPFKRPRRWFWVSSLPRTASGKPDRAAAIAHFSGLDPSQPADPVD